MSVTAHRSHGGPCLGPFRRRAGRFPPADQGTGPAGISDWRGSDGASPAEQLEDEHDGSNDEQEPALFTTWGKNIFPGAEQIAHDASCRP